MIEVPIKHVTHVNRNVLASNTPRDQPFTYVDIGAVTGGEITLPDEETTFAEAPSRARRLAPVGATVLSTVRTYLRAIAQVPETSQDLVFSTGFAVLEATERVDPNYLYYACRSDTFIDEIVARSTGVGYPAITPPQMGTIPIVVPEIDEQRRIVTYLEVETGRLDHLVEQREVQRRLLQERLASRLDSEVGALDGTPCKMKHLCAGAGQYGFNVSPSQYQGVADGGLRLLRTTDITNSGLIPDEDGIYIPSVPDDRFILREGDLLASRSGTIGRAFLVPEEAAGMTFAGFLVRFRPRDGVNMSFVLHQMRSARVQSEVQRNAIISTIQNFNAERYGNLPMVAVPLAEQDAFCERVENMVRDTTSVMKSLDESVGYLRERKQALITAAVAGNIDVTTTRSVS